MMIPKIIAVLVVWIACLGSGVAIGQEVDTTTGSASESPPPWENPLATGRSVPTIYISEWKKAENRDRCQPLILLGAEREPGARTRRQSFQEVGLLLTISQANAVPSESPELG